MAITYNETGYNTGQDAGQVSSHPDSVPGRLLKFLESLLTHPTHTDGFANAFDPVVVGADIVGVVTPDNAAAATDLLTVDTAGIYNLSVVATNGAGNIAVTAGDAIYIAKSTAILSKDSNQATHLPFGKALGAVGSGSTLVIAVQVGDVIQDLATVRAGTSSAYLDSALVNHRFQDYNYSNSAATGDNRGMYLRLNHITAGAGGGEALRAYCNVTDVAKGTAHGAHISLDFGSTGSLSGLGVAMRATLHVPNQTVPGGTLAAIQPEIWSDGASSSIASAPHSFIRCSNGGNATGVADVDDNANLIELTGGATASGNLMQAKSSAAVTHVIRCKIHGVTSYIMMSDAV